MAANVNCPGVVPGVRRHFVATVGRVIAATAEAVLFAWTILVLSFCLLVLTSFFLA
jgi:hypothetical protein